MGRYSNCTYFDSLYNAVNDVFPAVSESEAHSILRETILAPDDYTVEFNNSSYGQNQLYVMIANQLVSICVDDTPEQTFFNTLENAAQIVKHMNDGYISQEDAQERADFIDRIEHDEFCLFAAHALFKTARMDDEKRLSEIKLNIVRLREINDLISLYTREGADLEVGREEFERARPIYRMLKSLQSLGYEYNFSLRERESLGIDHEKDEDLTDSFHFSNWLKRITLLQLRKELDENTVPYLEAQTAQNYREELENSVLNRIYELRGTTDKRKFDKERFLMLKQSETEE